MTELARQSCPAWLTDVPFAHRGLHGPGVPENSLPAFIAAAERGYGIELDVRLSADHVPVICHDRSVARTTGVDADVEDLTAEQLGALRLGRTDAHPPTLTEVVEAAGQVPLMLELKSARPWGDRLEREVTTVMADHSRPWCVASFNPWSLLWFARNLPEVVRVLTARRARSFVALRRLLPIRPAAVSFELEGLPNPSTDAWRARGGPLIAWTAVGRQGVERALEVADNVIFEDALP